MALTNLNKLFVRVTDASLRNAVITKSAADNKIYFLTTTHEIINHGAAYGLSTDVQAQIANIKSILKSFDNNGHGTEDEVKTAIDAVQTALETEKTNREAADNAEKAAREAAIKGITDALADPATFWEDYTPEAQP